MDSKSIYDEIFDKPCSVCGEIIKKDIYEQGDCPYCKWKNNHFTDINPKAVLYPNLISLNKAKKLYSEGKPFEPDFNEYIEALHNYGEMQFEYNGTYYAVELVYDKNKKLVISLYNSQTKESIIFSNDEDFKNNAQVEDKLLKDVWDDTTDRDWLH